jgi:hypothetical protein
MRESIRISEGDLATAKKLHWKTQLLSQTGYFLGKRFFCLMRETAPKIERFFKSGILIACLK